MCQTCTYGYVFLCVNGVSRNVIKAWRLPPLASLSLVHNELEGPRRHSSRQGSRYVQAGIKHSINIHISARVMPAVASNPGRGSTLFSSSRLLRPLIPDMTAPLRRNRTHKTATRRHGDSDSDVRGPVRGAHAYDTLIRTRVGCGYSVSHRARRARDAQHHQWPSERGSQ